MEWRHTVWPDGQLVYSAIAKVANTSVKSALLETFLPEVPRGNPHDEGIPYQTVQGRKVRETYPTFCHFAVTRNPFDRMVSFWADKIIGTGWYRKLGQLGFRREMSFDSAVRVAADIPDSRTDPHLRSQVRALTDASGRVRPDLLLRFEHLSHDWEILRRIVKETSGQVLVPLPVRRTSARNDWRNYYDDASRSLVIDRYREDFTTLGYATDDVSPGSGQASSTLRSVMPGRAGALVLDMAGPDWSHREVVRSAGGLYLAPATDCLGQLVRHRAFSLGRLPVGAVDVLIQGTPDTPGRTPQPWLTAQLRERNRLVIPTAPSQT